MECYLHPSTLTGLTAASFKSTGIERLYEKGICVRWIPIKLRVGWDCSVPAMVCILWQSKPFRFVGVSYGVRRDEETAGPG